MGPFRPSIVFLLALWACSGGVDPGPDPDPMTEPRWQSFGISSIKQQRQAQGVGFLEFLDEPSVRMGLYHLPAGAMDGQDAHSLDEVYYVVNGEATIAIEGTDYPVAAGSSIFVKANADHRFHSITEDLDVVVIFAKGSPNQADPDGLAFQLDDVVASRSATQNIWNPFIGVSTMSLGMYMLPRSLNGDQTLTHPFDEINIMVNGGGQFTMDDDTIDIEPGTIVFVADGVGHRFHDLTGDVDVLIWWEGVE